MGKLSDNLFMGSEFERESDAQPSPESKQQLLGEDKDYERWAEGRDAENHRAVEGAIPF